MATTLGGVTLADPLTPIAIDEEWTGIQTEAHDGTVLTDYTDLYRLVWHLEWEVLTQSQRDTIRTRYEVATSQTFSPPHEVGSYTVIVVRQTWEEEVYLMGGGSYMYNVSFDVKEAS